MVNEEKMVGSERPQSLEGVQYHIQCRKGDVSRYVLLPGDPARVPKIAEFFDEAKQVAFHREYNTFTGKTKGIPISSTSSGIGGPALNIAVEELAQVGADTFIRVGTCGGIQPGVDAGDLVISSAAVRLNDASIDYVDLGYPASASHEVTLALIQAAEELGLKYHVGITASANTFFCGQGRPGFSGFWQSKHDVLVADLQRAKVLNFEMEAATLFTLCNLFGLRAGTVCAVVANRVDKSFATPEVYERAEKDTARVAVKAVEILARWDAEAKKAGKRWWYPGLHAKS